jgi:hypothetical protein
VLRRAMRKAPVIALVLALLAVTSPAYAASWSTAAQLPGMHGPLVSLVADDGSAWVFAARQVYDDQSWGNYAVYASRQPAGGAFEAPVRLSPVGETAGLSGAVLDDAGRLHVVWYASAAQGEPFLRSAVWLPTLGWQPSSVVPGSSGVGTHAFAVNGSGRELIVWAPLHNPDDLVATGRAFGGAWSAPASVRPAGDSGLYEVAGLGLADDGRATLLWKRGASLATLFARTLSPAGSWGTPRQLSSSSAGTLYPAFDMNAGGDVGVAWVEARREGDVVTSNLAHREYRPGTGWSARHVVTTGVAEAAPRIALDDQHRSTLVWQRRTSDSLRPVQYAVRSAPGSWSSRRELLPAGTAAQLPWLDVDGAGVTHLAWVAARGSEPRASWMRRVPGSPWTAPYQILRDSWADDGSASDISLSVTPGGDALVAWAGLYDTTVRLRHAG